MIEVIKASLFQWTPKAQKSLRRYQVQAYSSPNFNHCFDEVFEVECDAFKVGIST